MATASFNTDSPNTSEYNILLHCSSGTPMMARVATGSTAEIRAPNKKLQWLHVTLHDQHFATPEHSAPLQWRL